METQTPAPVRIESIDMLRGLFAASIMVYHTLVWTFPQWFEHPTGVIRWVDWLGIYGVEGFFVISAFSLYHVYRHRPLGTKGGIRDFFWKRFVRLWPLYTLAMLVAIVARRVLEHKGVSGLDVLLNGTLTFGFINPARSLIVGGWSIGVEIVLYALFVPLVILSQKKQAAFWSALAVLFVVAVAYPFVFLKEGVGLPDQWAAYVNVFNHVGFFALGIGLYLGWEKNPAIGQLVPLLTLSAALRLSMAYVDQTATTLGEQRVWSLILTGGLCFIACRIRDTHDKLMRPFAFLGAISYSVYLLHPFCYKLIEKAHVPGGALVGVTWASTIGLAAASYRWLEKPLMAWGRNYAKRWSAQ